MHVCNLVDPSVEANIFFEKEEVTEKGKLDFETEIHTRHNGCC